MNLSQKQKYFLKGLCHNLKTIIQTGEKGISQNLITEINNNLLAHELIKIKINSNKEEFLALSKEVLKQTKSLEIEKKGKTFCIYKQNPKNIKISLPKN